MDRAGQVQPLGAEPRAYGWARVSPDGTRVAVHARGDDNTDVWICDLTRENLTRLTFDEAFDGFPLWSPEGSRVVFQSQREGGGLFSKAADGTGEVERLLESSNSPAPYAWSPDGRLIFRQPPGDIGVLTVEGDGTVDMLLETEFDEDVPAQSSDGRWLAYMSEESGQNEIYVQPFPNLDEGKWLVSTDGGTDPVWSPDGQELFFWLPGTGLMVSKVQTDPTFTPGNPERVFDTTGYRLDSGGRRYDISPNGEHFVMVLSGGAQTAGDDEPFNGLIFVENWFEELKERVPVS